MEKKLYLIMFRGEDGSARPGELIAVTRASDKQEAQDLAGIKQSERGFYPAEEISSKDYLKMVMEAGKKFNKIKTILQ